MTETNQIKRTADFSLPAERVWRAVTDPEELSSWFSDHVQMVFQVGQEIVFKWDQYGTASGRIELIEPPVRFAFRWRAHNVPDVEPITESNSTLVTFTVTPKAEGARLTVVESGFANLPESMRVRTFQENTSGWQAEFEDLLAYFAEEL
jgi:uncharacterized protein YndB with AHSA1/START domain